MPPKPSAALPAEAVTALREGQADAALHYSARGAQTFMALARKAGLASEAAGADPCRALGRGRRAADRGRRRDRAGRRVSRGGGPAGGARPGLAARRSRPAASAIPRSQSPQRGCYRGLRRARARRDGQGFDEPAQGSRTGAVTLPANPADARRPGPASEDVTAVAADETSRLRASRCCRPRPCLKSFAAADDRAGRACRRAASGCRKPDCSQRHGRSRCRRAAQALADARAWRSPGWSAA